MRQFFFFFFFFFLSFSTLSYGFVINNKPIVPNDNPIVPIPRDTFPNAEAPTSGVADMEKILYGIICYKNYDATTLYILPYFSQDFSQDDVEIVIFERVRGVVFTGTIDLSSYQPTIIDTPWGKGVYTIIFKVSDNLILQGDFVIR